MALRFRKGLTAFLVLVLAGSLLGLVISAYKLYRAHALNTAIVKRDVSQIPDDAPPALLFAKAYRLRRDGQLQDALAIYRRLEHVPQRNLSMKANYNVGNIYVTLAELLAQSARIKDVGTMIGIARSQYQQALRLASNYYDAKYNLEWTRFMVTERQWQKQQYRGGLNRQRERSKMNWPQFHRLPQGLP